MSFLATLPVRASLLASSLLLVAWERGHALENDFVWPTEASRCLTANFCEFRPGHFHAGIDLSTWGKTGFRCFAVADGDIVRARVSCHGYGKAVYLRLKDGRYAVYAHLESFEGALADSVKALQQRKGSIYFDESFAAGSLPVKRGDVIARTGQSGIGVPHLHFELRDAQERPLDPLDVGFDVVDTTPPVPLRVSVTPLTPTSSVDGRSDTQVFDVLPGKQAHRGRLARVLPVEGEIGLGIEVDETADDCRYRLAPKRLELREGDRVLYALEYDRFAFSQSRLIDFQIDPRFSYSKFGRFHQVFRREGNDLPFEEPSEGNGIVRARQISPERRAMRRTSEADSLNLPSLVSVQKVGERVRDLRIVVVDREGNEGAVDLSLSFAPPPSLPVFRADFSRSQETALDEARLDQVWSDSLQIEGKVGVGGRPLRHVELSHSSDGGFSWSELPAIIPERDHTFRTQVAVSPRIPGEARASLLRARAVDVLGATSWMRTIAVGSNVSEIVEPPTPEWVTLGGWVEARFGPEVGWSVLAGGWDAGGEAVLVRPWGRGIRIVLPGSPPSRAQRAWSGLGAPFQGFDPWGRPVPLVLNVPVEVPAADSEAILVESGLARLRFPEGALREDVAVVVRTEPSPLPEAELRPLGPLQFVELGQVPLASRFELTLRPEVGTTFDASRVGIFERGAKGFKFVAAELSKRDAGAWVVRTKSRQGLGLFEDTVDPVVSGAELDRSRDGSLLRFLVEDRGAGVDCDGVSAFVEGLALLVEFDEETGAATAFVADDLLRPVTSFEMRAVDRCGNSTRTVVDLRTP